jgi:hypothetical protein
MRSHPELEWRCEKEKKCESGKKGDMRGLVSGLVCRVGMQALQGLLEEGTAKVWYTPAMHHHIRRITQKELVLQRSTHPARLELCAAVPDCDDSVQGWQSHSSVDRQTDSSMGW